MKGLKKALSIIICVAMVTTMFACGVAAEETSTEEVAVAEETAEVSSYDAEEMIDIDSLTQEEIDQLIAEMDKFMEADIDDLLEQGLEKLHSSEVPEEFFLVPKEKMVIEGWDWDFAFLHDKINKGELSWEMFEPMYSYVAIVINHDYLKPKGISTEEFEVNFLLEDLDKMKEYYASAIRKDQLSYNLSESYSEYNLSDFKGDAELTECIMRALYTFCITAGVDPADFWSGRDFETFYGLYPDKITFSEEQLHYFDD